MTKRHLPLNDPLGRIRCRERCAALSDVQQIAIAAACAGYVLHFFKEHLSENAWVLEGALTTCWEAVEGKAVVDFEPRFTQLNDAVPDSEEHCLYAGLPAAEAVIAALETASTGRDGYEAVASSLEAVEMNESLREHPPEETARAVSGSMALLTAELVSHSQPVKDYVAFVDNALAALERGTDPLLLKR